MQPWLHLETFASKTDSRLEKLAPGQFSKVLMRGFQQVHQSWNTNRTTASNGLPKFEWGSRSVQKQAGSGCSGCCFATIQTPDDAGCTVPAQEKSATADSRRLRFDNAEDELGGDSSVRGRAAGV